MENSQAEEKPVDLAVEARKEWEASKEPEKEESEPSTEKPEAAKAEPQDVTEDSPSEKEAEKAEEVKPEEVVEEKPVEEKKEEPVDEKVVQEWAIKHGMTLAEATEDLAKTKSVVQKYKSPEEMARALRQMQSQYDKIKNEAGKTEDDQFKISSNPRIEVFEYVRQNQSDIVEKYRQNYPAKTRDMEDDAILEEVADKLLTGYEKFNQGQIKKLNDVATKRRDELLSSLEERDRRFLPDVKAVLDKTNDRVLVSKNFSLNDIVWWAKGQQYDKEIKAAEERGAKNEREKAKILGVVPSSRTESTAPAVKGGTRLSEYEKRLAREMFSTTTFTDEEKYEAYAEVTKKSKRK